MPAVEGRDYLSYQMPGQGFIGDLLMGLMPGIQTAMQIRNQKRADEELAMRKELHQHELAKIKLGEKEQVLTNKARLLGLLTGTPGEQAPMQGPPTEDQTNAMGGTDVAPIATRDVGHKPISFAGLTDIGVPNDLQITPPTLQEVLAREIYKKKQEALATRDANQVNLPQAVADKIGMTGSSVDKEIVPLLGELLKQNDTTAVPPGLLDTLPEGGAVGDKLLGLLKFGAEEKGKDKRSKVLNDAIKGGAGKPPKLRLVTTVDENGDPVQKFVPEEEGASYTKPKATPPRSSPTERTAIADMSSAVDRVQSLVDSFKPEYVGNVKGAVGALQEKIPAGMPGAMDQKENDFRMQNQSLQNEVIKFVTGAQMSKEEAERILKTTPGLGDQPANWKVKATRLLANMQQKLEARKKALPGAGAAAGGTRTPPAPPPGATAWRDNGDGTFDFQMPDGSVVTQ